MPKIHYYISDNSGCPFCMNRVDMKVFSTTEDKDKITCQRCLMKLGIIENTLGNWKDHTRKY
jgi:hypothetical protein